MEDKNVFRGFVFLYAGCAIHLFPTEHRTSLCTMNTNEVNTNIHSHA